MATTPEQVREARKILAMPILEALRTQDLRQAQLARRIGTSPQALNNYLLGKRDMPEEIRRKAYRILKIRGITTAASARDSPLPRGPPPLTAPLCQLPLFTDRSA